eukprot:COSAG03_NODE_2009_length_3227_cov_4.238171_5_plen_112_part_00
MVRDCIATGQAASCCCHILHVDVRICPLPRAVATLLLLILLQACRSRRRCLLLVNARVTRRRDPSEVPAAAQLLARSLCGVSPGLAWRRAAVVLPCSGSAGWGGAGGGAGG